MARIDDTQRVFDVSKPHKTSPSATSKPVIVGHRPMMNDPMVKEEEKSEPAMPGEVPKVTSVPVFTHASEPQPPKEHEHHELNIEPHMDSPPEPVFEPVEPKEAPHQEQPAEEPHFTPLHSMLNEHNDGELVHDSHVKNDNEHLIGALPLPHPPGAGPKKRWKKILAWSSGAVLLLAVGAYLVIDSGVVENDIKLPFSIFGDSEHEEHDNMAQTPASPVGADSEAEPLKDLPAKELPKFTSSADWEVIEINQVKTKFYYPKGWKITKKSEFGREQIYMDSPEYKIFADTDAPSELDVSSKFVSEGGQFDVLVVPAGSSKLDEYKRDDAAGYLIPEWIINWGSLEGVMGSCGEGGPGLCTYTYVLHGDYLYMFTYTQPNASSIKTHTGKSPATPKDKYLQQYLQLLSSIEFRDN